MALAQFDSSTSMTLANLGNVEVRVWSGEERLQFIVRRGILGVGQARAIVQQHRWEPGWTLVLHSDGLRAHWQWSDFPGLERQPAQAIADSLLHKLARDDDDATVVVVRG